MNNNDNKSCEKKKIERKLDHDHFFSFPHYSENVKVKLIFIYKNVPIEKFFDLFCQPSRANN